MALKIYFENSASGGQMMFHTGISMNTMSICALFMCLKNGCGAFQCPERKFGILKVEYKSINCEKCFKK